MRGRGRDEGGREGGGGEGGRREEEGGGGERVKKGCGRKTLCSLLWRIGVGNNIY